MIAFIASILFCLSLAKGTLQIEGKFQGVELIITSGESTHALGALPEIKYLDGKTVLDFGEVSSSLPPLLKRRIRVFVGPEVNSIDMCFTLEFSSLSVKSLRLDTLRMSFLSKFTGINIRMDTVQFNFIDGSSVGGTVEVTGFRNDEMLKLSLLGTTVKVNKVFRKGVIELSSEASTIFFPEGKHVIQSEGFFNRKEFLDGIHGESKGIIKVLGNFNKIFVGGN
ncbi:MAG: hypothetical protein ABIM20_06895 [candidate division WOR-3 bacterium]